MQTSLTPSPPLTVSTPESFLGSVLLGLAAEQSMVSSAGVPVTVVAVCTTPALTTQGDVDEVRLRHAFAVDEVELGLAASPDRGQDPLHITQMVGALMDTVARNGESVTGDPGDQGGPGPVVGVDPFQH